MPVTNGDWIALENFTVNAKIDKYWLGAQIKDTSKLFTDIAWMYSNTFCGNLTWSPLSSLNSFGGKSGKTCITVDKNGKWNEEDCTNTKIAVCEFGMIN